MREITGPIAARVQFPGILGEFSVERLNYNCRSVDVVIVPQREWHNTRREFIDGKQARMMKFVARKALEYSGIFWLIFPGSSRRMESLRKGSILPIRIISI